MDGLAAANGLEFFQREGQRAVKSEALAGGLQNTNFKVTTAAGLPFVVRVPAGDAAQHGQDQGVVYANASAAAAAGLGPAPVAFDKATGIIVTQFITGTVMCRQAEDKFDIALLPRFVAAVKRLHTSKVEFVPSTASDVISGYPITRIAELLSGGVPPRALALQDLLTRCLGAFEPVVGCHNDLAPSNCIMDGDNTFLIDWEWAGPFDVVHDLSNLALLCELDEAGEDEVLALYFGSDAVSPIHRCRMKLWHLHSTSREALWCGAKSRNPAEQGVAAGYDYIAEGRKYAQKFADQLASPQTAALMAQLEAALASLTPID